MMPRRSLFPEKRTFREARKIFPPLTVRAAASSARGARVETWQSASLDATGLDTLRVEKRV